MPFNKKKKYLFSSLSSFRFADESSSPTLRSPKFAPSPPNIYYKGWWTFPYFSCSLSKWILSYSIAIPPNGRHGLRGFISIDIDVTGLRVNQCEAPVAYRFNYQQIQTRRLHLVDTQTSEYINDIQAFHKSHKCHRDTMVVSSWGNWEWGGKRL